MPCKHIKNGDSEVIICSRSGKRCKYCGQYSTQLCDEPIGLPEAKRTCDIPLCRNCSYQVGALDYCRVHAKNHLADGKANSKQPEDPRWICAKYQSKCFECGGIIDKGNRVLWYPQERRLLCEPCAHPSMGAS